MTPLFLVLALIIQSSFIRAEDVDIPETKDELLESFKRPDVDDQVVKGVEAAGKDWMDLFSMSHGNWFPTSSVAMMAQATNCNKTLEEQLEAIKEVANQINQLIQSEMANLINYSMACQKKEDEKEQLLEENGLRKRRSVETPLDSTQMIMRLLKHIKSNNEYQNICIENMMSAQEIADKFGVDFTPDPDVLSDLAVSSTEHAKELNTMLKDACELKNVTEVVDFVPVTEEQKSNETYFVYSVKPEATVEDVPPFEYKPEVLPPTQSSMNHVHSHPDQHHSHHAHHHHHNPVTPRPSFYDVFSSPDYFNSYYAADPFTTTLLIPIEDPEPEPEMFGEEIEEIISTKLFVEKGLEPGTSTVNHVTTYTVSERTHYRPPQIEQLPEQFQYCFFLI